MCADVLWRARVALSLVLAAACASGPAARQGQGTAASGPAEASKRLDFRGGDPWISVRLMEGAEEVLFSPRGRMRLRASGAEKALELPAGALLRVRRVRGTEAALRYWLQAGVFAFEDEASLTRARADWERKGLATRVQVLGSVLRIAGKVIDNRRRLLLLKDGYDAVEPAKARQAELLRSHGLSASVFEELRQGASGTLELLDDGGASLLLAEDGMDAETLDDAGFDVRRVEFDVGYASHNFEDRSYRGALRLTFDRHGKIAVVNLVSLEHLLYGLVPSEIFATAPPEALKAQAVSARSEVLAKIGLKHLGDPYLLCSEQHCAVYKGLSGEKASTTAAVEATRGEGLFGARDELVDAVYSSNCGGHGEDNEVVWGGVPNPVLRGRPDFIHPTAGAPSPKDLPSFLAGSAPAACGLATIAVPGKHRWERRFTAQEVDAFAAPLQIGHVREISVDERGVSGRARVLTLAGDLGATQLRGELNIRRFFGMLNSALFLVSSERDARGELSGWVFRGGGWGHGVGMCQTGAIGRAEAGQSYRAILGHYFGGAQVLRVY